ncbi:MAG: GNAT family N-acetyltransferase [Saprospiraceae bacterium]|nr:GNAT family N-acetyltransferase [Saprospiraceae bacterium]
MNLQTEIAHIGLRPLSSQDLPDLVRHANNPNIARFLRDRFPSPYTDQDARTYLEMQPVEGTPQNLAITDRGHLIGMIGVIPQDDVYRLNAEFGYWVSEDFWRQGIATAAIKVFVPWSFPKQIWSGYTPMCLTITRRQNVCWKRPDSLLKGLPDMP